MANKYDHGLAIKWGSEIYYVPAEAWQKEKLPDDLKAEVQQLVSRGSILGSVSQTGEGIGSACYLVDLSAIKPDV
ncbi:hypothetical protein [Aestuariispira ectoiniformans]|uniref:hypothetical protein n=1 Tax=Aestuariispira ectoiniformans TaxID=2775080 RepID=UPI00223C1765|nr:hypothetical protein [Aestuariispira ectoiniformans]